MGLMICPDCGRKVSTTAMRCPGCGGILPHPLPVRGLFGGCAAVVLSLVCGFGAGFVFQSPWGFLIGFFVSLAILWWKSGGRVV